ncbi:MAG: ABC transporter ATP-binding protein [Geminicoccaceae bacterium]
MERSEGGSPISGSAPPVVLELVQVEKSYGEVRVLAPTDLAVRDGEFLIVVGPSGSGKTTVLRLIGGFTAPSKGDIRFEGRSIRDVPINRRPFNTVFQDYALFPHMSVAENVGYGLLMRRTPKAEAREKVAQALRLVRLENLGDRLPAQLSGGQRQRVALARAIVLEPRVVLLDEPLGALDAALRREMQLFLKEIQRSIRTTFLFVTHDQEEAISMGDRICVMDHGRIVQLGTPEEIYWQPDDVYVARFFGDANLIPGKVAGREGTVRIVSTALGPIRCADRADLADGDTVQVMIRPEALHIDGAGENRLEARVREVEFAGPMFQLDLTVGDVPLKAKLPSRAAGAGFAPGTSVTLGLAAADARPVRE